MRYSARCPVRLDLAGYWSSLQPFAQRHGGGVVTAAVQPYVTGTISRPQPEGLSHRLRGDRHYVAYALDLPRGSGLGASAAQTVLWVTLTKTVIADTSDRRQIAHIAGSIERMLGAGSTAVDAYSCALGGWIYLDITDVVAAESLTYGQKPLDSLEQRLVMAYTGAAPPSAGLINAVASRFQGGSTQISSTLSKMKPLARYVRDMAVANNFDALAEVMQSEWALQKQLDERISNSKVDAILDLALKNGATAGKLCGAGGGGFLLLLTENGQRSRLRAVLRNRRLRTLDVRFDWFGVHLENPDVK